jgi:hypothetical protein
MSLRTITSPSYLITHLGLQLFEGVSVELNRDKSAAFIIGAKKFNSKFLPFTEEDLTKDGLLPVNRALHLSFGIATNPRGPALLFPSYELATLGVIVGQTAPIIYGQPRELGITLLPTRQVSLPQVLATLVLPG